jgi:hypothetical protein
VLDVLGAMFFTLVEATDDIVLLEELEVLVVGLLVGLRCLSLSSNLKQTSWGIVNLLLLSIEFGSAEGKAGFERSRTSCIYSFSQ